MRSCIFVEQMYMYITIARKCILHMLIHHGIDRDLTKRSPTDANTLSSPQGQHPVQPCFGPPSLTSSFAAAKPQSLLVLTVECIDQPKTEGATDFHIRMRLIDSDTTEQIEHGHRMIEGRHHESYSNAAAFQRRSIFVGALWLRCQGDQSTGGLARPSTIKYLRLLAVRAASDRQTQNAFQADSSSICNYVPLSGLRRTLPASIVAGSNHQ